MVSSSMINFFVLNVINWTINNLIDKVDIDASFLVVDVVYPEKWCCISIINKVLLLHVNSCCFRIFWYWCFVLIKCTDDFIFSSNNMIKLSHLLCLLQTLFEDWSQYIYFIVVGHSIVLSWLIFISYLISKQR